MLTIYISRFGTGRCDGRQGAVNAGGMFAGGGNTRSPTCNRGFGATVCLGVRPPFGSCFNSLSSNSEIAFSATGFLLMFFMRPISRLMASCWRVGSSFRATKPGVWSTLTVTGRPLMGRRSRHSRAKVSRSDFAFSSGTMDATVYDVEASRKTRIACLLRLSTSAVKEVPTMAGGSSVVWNFSGSNSRRKEVHV